MPGHDQDHSPSLSSTGEEVRAAGRGRRHALLRGELAGVEVDVVAAGRRDGCAATTDCEASDDIEAFDLAVLEVAKAEHRACLLLSQFVHGLSFLEGLVEPVDKEGVTICDAP
jgi:hypothetical protein